MTPQAALPERPPFKSLPLDKSGPPGNAWGLYGADDSLGALNLLTPEVIAEASKEIQLGERVSLDWQLTKPSQSSFDRPPFRKELVNKTMPGQPRRHVNDDVLHFNTQCSSQWDGFRHYGYQKAHRYYGDRTHGDIEATDIIGIHSWVEKGGIVGRGVLLDYPAFCERKEIAFDALSSSAISLDHIKQMAEETGVTFRSGDILLVRAGFTAAYEALGSEARHELALRPSPDFLGVESTAATLQWLWESGFAAVASDAPSFEQAPITGPHTAIGGAWAGEPWEEEMQTGGLLHQWLLAGWGVPIGEMFDLEALAAKCKELGRSTFFVSSVPLKVPGGVASPPNAIAIF
ncbi:Major facilitator superfamily transporter [Pleurostoma richardsiae]|uniref:Major facilitator superfamily transporter n=1 Tax=Pleurostoma richardsiae TaxID=41990 RepID=A0AA38RKB5_9PEZI|nr:Major facilitator superfamily transporter [Pleurostoma richardsiae]